MSRLDPVTLLGHTHHMTRRLPPRDSWIQLKAGEEFLFDTEAVTSAQRQLQRYGREVRGAVLVAGYELEWMIDQLLLQSFLPAPNSAEDLRQLFDDLFLKQSPLRFAHKIKMLKAVHKTVLTVSEALPADILPLLDKVRDLRNTFAHYPATLIPDGPEPITKLRIVLNGPDRDIPLDDHAVAQMLQDIGRASDALNQAIAKLMPAPGVA